EKGHVTAARADEIGQIRQLYAVLLYRYDKITQNQVFRLTVVHVFRTRPVSFGDLNMKTYSAKPSEIEKKWLLIDAEGLVVGRLASLVALRLRGKHKPTFTPHMDDGDNVIIINAAKVL